MFFQAAYTFDAGANACVYLLESEVSRFMSFVNAIYPNDILPAEEYIRGIPVQSNSPNKSVILNVIISMNWFLFHNFCYFYRIFKQLV